MMKSYRKALVLGAGLSGLGAARLLVAEGTDVTVVDGRPASELTDASAQLDALGARGCWGTGAMPPGRFDLCVVSPGFDVHGDTVRAAREISAELLPEIELGWSRATCRTIAVTGSNGKSTAVKWCAETLERAGCRVAVAGNYGRSVCAVVLEETDLDWLVLEISSFQLETVCDFRVDIGCLTNIHPNHLDRHENMETYTQLKSRLFARSTRDDSCVVPQNRLRDMQRLSGGRGHWISFGCEADADVQCRGGRVFQGGVERADFSATPFGQPGLEETAAALTAMMDGAGVDVRHAVEAAKEYQSLPHRLQSIAEIAGVRYINDSKSTNLAAIGHALRAMPGPVRLIAGGLAKENNFDCLQERLAERVQTVYLVGKSAEQMFSAWSRDVPCVMSGTLDEALRQARDDAQSGEVVLLSPGCASFDQFRNYEQRGEHFSRLVLQLAGKEIS